MREYNQSYNFFSGMNADAVARYQKDALTGHSPTWKIGANGTKGKGKTAEADLEAAADPFSMFSELNGRGRWRPGPGSGSEAKVETRKVFNAERKALQVMGWPGGDARGGKGKIQGAGETASPRRQWRRPLHRGPPDRDHQGV